jgi:hypothetical protein
VKELIKYCQALYDQHHGAGTMVTELCKAFDIEKGLAIDVVAYSISM